MAGPLFGLVQIESLPAHTQMLRVSLALVTSNEKLNSVRFEAEPILAREKWI